MSVKPNPIRIIKRKQREHSAALDDAQITPSKSENELRRAMAREVSSWIVERRETEITAWQKAALLITVPACEVEAT